MANNIVLTPKQKDELIGQRFGNYIIQEWKVLDHKTKVRAVCICGAEKWVEFSHLRLGYIISCGCYHRELKRIAKTTHGLNGHRLYRIMGKMVSRCYNPSVGEYKWYGARGISICSQWREDFRCFYDWCLENGWEDGKKLQIDRINNDGNYEPGNCRWVSCLVNASNTRKNVKYTYKGETLHISEWARRVGVDRCTMRTRFQRWSIEDAINTPIFKHAGNK